MMRTDTVSNIGTREGRAALQRYWHDLIVDQRSFALPALFRLWQTSMRGSSFTLAATGETVQISYPLGVRNGTKVFMEEIIVRHYFNNVQALVYLGAVLLLIFLALRFAGLLSEEIALIGIAIEVLMLLMLFVVLFYTPEEEGPSAAVAGRVEGSEASGDEVATIREVLEELEEIGGSYASLGMRLEEMVHSQERSLAELSDHVRKIQGLDQLNRHTTALESTNLLLGSLVDSMDRMTQRVDLLLGKELEYRVRRELERHIAPTLGPENGSGGAPFDTDQ